jgi:hypothetical protein
MHRDLVFGIITLAIAAGYYAMAAGLPDTRLADAIGPAGLPRTYAFLLAGLSLLLIVGSVGRPGGGRQPDTRSGAEGAPPSPVRAAGLLAIGAIYILVIPWLGYLVSIAGLLAATVWYQGARFRPAEGLVAIAGAIFFWLLFVALLGIPHPPGAWGSLF